MRFLSLAIIISLIFIPLSTGKKTRLPKLPDLDQLERWRMKGNTVLEVGSTAQVLWDWKSHVCFYFGFRLSYLKYIVHKGYVNPFGLKSLSAEQKKRMGRRTVIVFEVFDDGTVTVVPLMHWIPKTHKKGGDPQYATAYFEDFKGNEVLNFDQGKIVDKTELFRVEGVRILRPPYLVIEKKFNEIKSLLAEIRLKAGSSTRRVVAAGGGTAAGSSSGSAG
jgi:hypothetical protein